MTDRNRMKLLTTFALVVLLTLLASCTGKPTTPEERARLQGMMDYEDEQQQQQMYNELGPDSVEEAEAEGEIPLNSDI